MGKRVHMPFWFRGPICGVRVPSTVCGDVKLVTCKRCLRILRAAKRKLVQKKGDKFLAFARRAGSPPVSVLASLRPRRAPRRTRST